MQGEQFVSSYEWPPTGGGGGSGGVTSLNTLTGAVVIVPGVGIGLSVLGNDITLSSSAILSINSDTTQAQTLSVGTSGTDFAITDPGSGSHVFNLPTASATSRGALSSADWNSFNGKTSGGITSLTGDVTASGGGAAAATLATVNTNTGSFGSSTAIPSFTVNGKGLITAASTNVVIAPAGTLSGTTLSSSVVSSSLTSVGTLSSLAVSGTETVPIVAGGTAASSTLTLESTSGAGTSDSIIFKTGSQINTLILDTNHNANFFGQLKKIVGANGTIGSPAAEVALAYVGSLGSTNFTNITVLNSFQNNNASWMEFLTTPAASSTPVVALTLDQNQNATFAGTVTSSGNISSTGSNGFNASGSGGIQGVFNSTNASGVVVNFNNSSSIIGQVGSFNQVLSGGNVNDFAIGSAISGRSLVLATVGVAALTISSSQNVISSAGVATINYDTSTVTTGTITAAANKPGIVVNSAGGVTLTVKLPSSPIDGQRWFFASVGNFTTVTWQDSGGTAGNVVGGQTSVGGVSRGQTFVYSAALTKWISTA